MSKIDRKRKNPRTAISDDNFHQAEGSPSKKTKTDDSKDKDSSSLSSTYLQPIPSTTGQNCQTIISFLISKKSTNTRRDFLLFLGWGGNLDVERMSYMTFYIFSSSQGAMASQSENLFLGGQYVNLATPGSAQSKKCDELHFSEDIGVESIDFCSNIPMVFVPKSQSDAQSSKKKSEQQCHNRWRVQHGCILDVVFTFRDQTYQKRFKEMLYANSVRLKSFNPQIDESLPFKLYNFDHTVNQNPNSMINSSNLPVASASTPIANVAINDLAVTAAASVVASAISSAANAGSVQNSIAPMTILATMSAAVAEKSSLAATVAAVRTPPTCPNDGNTSIPPLQLSLSIFTSGDSAKNAGSLNARPNSTASSSSEDIFTGLDNLIELEEDDDDLTDKKNQQNSQSM